MGAGFIILPIIDTLLNRWIMINGSEADATVVRTEKRYDGENGTSYRPILRYEVNGEVFEKPHTTSTPKPMYEDGAVVRIYYHNRKPHRFVLLNDKPRMIINSVFAVIGVILIAISVIIGLK
jgi:hypothetical protein